MEVRLNKFLSQAGITSRRKADELIKQGRVKVNQEVVKDLGFKIDPSKDKVFVDEKPVKISDRKLYIKLYKPRGYLTQLGKDKFGRKTLKDLFEEIGLKDRVYPVGRLDYESEGLLILTNDGETANQIAHPRFKVPKTYIVEVKGKVNLPTFNKMKKGTFLEDGFLKPDEIKILKKKRNSTVLEITIHSGKKRIIRRFMKSFGHPVQRLIRTRIGNIKLGNLKEKQWESIPETDIQKLLSKSNRRKR